MILSTEEDTATLKVITATTKMILVTERSDHSHFTNYLSHYKRDLSQIRSDYILLNKYISHYKSDPGHKQTDLGH